MTVLIAWNFRLLNDAAPTIAGALIEFSIILRREHSIAWIGCAVLLFIFQSIYSLIESFIGVDDVDAAVQLVGLTRVTYGIFCG